MQEIRIDVIQTGPLGVNTSVVYRTGSHDCVVVDPADAEKLESCLESEDLICRAVLLTHGHYDHILGVRALRDKGAKVYIGKGDAPALTDRAVSLCPNYLSKQCEGAEADVLLSGGDTFEEANMTFRVIDTPGHTAGGVCYLLEEAGTVFSGDTLFRRGIGRYDLPGGNGVTLYNSIKEGLFSLDGDYKVIPGHGGATTMEEERASNMYMKIDPLKW